MRVFRVLLRSFVPKSLRILKISVVWPDKGLSSLRKGRFAEFSADILQNSPFSRSLIPNGFRLEGDEAGNTNLRLLHPLLIF